MEAGTTMPPVEPGIRCIFRNTKGAAMESVLPVRRPATITLVFAPISWVNNCGLLKAYPTVYDKTDKLAHENPSIGIILCQSANAQFVEILVQDYDKPMGVATYRTSQEMPAQLRETLPDIDSLQKLLLENEP